jgi:RNA recognition motif-containing protein
MPTNIYVGNLPWSTSADDLYQLFSQYGQVGKSQVVIDRDTGRSRGFGFVEMLNEPEAQAAIDALNNQPYNGRPLTVNIAKPRETSGPGAARGGYGHGASERY